MLENIGTLQPVVVSSADDIKAFLHLITPSSKLYIGMDGNNLGRKGTLTLLTIHIQPENKVRIIDVKALGQTAFTTASNDGTTLKSIFEDEKIPKYSWDVRAGADALWAHHEVGLAGVTDIQLLELASRRGNKERIRGLLKSIQYDIKLADEQRKGWMETKEKVKNLMAEDSELFSHRPMTRLIVRYCVNDVLYLPYLEDEYRRRLQDSENPCHWLFLVNRDSKARVEESRKEKPDPDLQDKTLGPWGACIFRENYGGSNQHGTLGLRFGRRPSGHP